MGVTGVRMFGKEERYPLPISTAVTRSIQKQLFVRLEDRGRSYAQTITSYGHAGPRF